MPKFWALLLSLSSIPNQSAVELIGDRLESSCEVVETLKDFLPEGFTSNKFEEEASPEPKSFNGDEPMTLSRLVKLQSTKQKEESPANDGNLLLSAD